MIPTLMSKLLFAPRSNSRSPPFPSLLARSFRPYHPPPLNPPSPPFCSPGGRWLHSPVSRPSHTREGLRGWAGGGASRPQKTISIPPPLPPGKDRAPISRKRTAPPLPKNLFSGRELGVDGPEKKRGGCNWGERKGDMAVWFCRDLGAVWFGLMVIISPAPGTGTWIGFERRLYLEYIWRGLE